MNIAGFSGRCGHSDAAEWFADQVEDFVKQRQMSPPAPVFSRSTSNTQIGIIDARIADAHELKESVAISIDHT